MDVQVEGVHSPVLVGGRQEADDAVVFVHGNAGSGRDWKALMESVSSFARCVAPDMPGYGGADKPQAFDYTVEGFGRHLGGVLDRLEDSTAHLVLHDLGGPWGLNWAAHHRPASPAFAAGNRRSAWLPVAHFRPDVPHAWSGRHPSCAYETAGRGAGVAPWHSWRITGRIRRRHGAQPQDPGTRRAVLRFYRATPDLAP